MYHTHLHIDKALFVLDMCVVGALFREVLRDIQRANLHNADNGDMLCVSVCWCFPAGNPWGYMAFSFADRQTKAFFCTLLVC